MIVQATGEFFLWHRYTFDSSVPVYNLYRGLRPADFDVAADRAALASRALAYEEDSAVSPRAHEGCWHPVDNPQPVWDQLNPSWVGLVGKKIVMDAAHMDDRFDGNVPTEGQLAQFQIIFDDPLLAGKTSQQMADVLGLRVEDIESLRHHYQLMSANRDLYRDIMDSWAVIRAIEFDTP